MSELEEKLKFCNICPHNCKVNRLDGKLGRCKAGKNVKVSLVSTHMYEEPIISGENGSGTIFFTGCNLGCVYCQNYEISNKNYGKEISVNRLKEIMLKQQEKGVENINLVTPTMYAYHIKEAIILAKAEGLKIPIVYNSGGYESVETLKALEGLIDIYLPDFKYIDDALAKKYSNVSDYVENVKEVLKEMRRQVKDEYDTRGMLKKGLVIRHMILPNNVENSKGVISWIKNNLGKDTIISIMAQYFPTNMVNDTCFKEINRKININELEEIENFLYEQDMLNGYIQELGEHEEEYVPNFNLDGV